MRSFYEEGEIIVAEVQTLYNEGAFGIHTRNLKYGKLVTGELITVQASLIRRSRSHFIQLPWQIEVILGMNGYAWVGKPRKTPDEQDLDTIYSSRLEVVTFDEREKIARTRNCILALNKFSRSIDEESIMNLFSITSQYEISDIVNENFLAKIFT